MKTTYLSSKLRFFFRGEVSVSSLNPFWDLTFRYHKAQSAVRFIYAYMFLIFLDNLGTVINLGRYETALNPPPVGLWLHHLSFNNAIFLIYTLFFLSLMGALLRPGVFIFRLFVFLSVLSSYTLQHSLGTIQHSQNGFIWITFILVFLPNRSSWPRISREYKLYYITTCWWAALTTLSVYSLSGTWKILIGILKSAYDGEHTFFTPQAMSYHLARYAVRNGYEPPLADLVIQNSWLGWPMITLAVYMQIFSFFTVFRPLTQSIWLLLLATFHGMNLVLMNLPFNHHGFLAVFVLAVFPFMRLPQNVYQTFATLPIIGFIYRRILKKMGKPAPAMIRVRSES